MLVKGIRNQASVTYSEVTDIEKFFKTVTDGEAMSTAKAERISAVAAAHRVYTNSMAVMPWMIRRRDGSSRLEAPEHYLNNILKRQMNERQTPYTVKKIMHSQAFWHGVGFCYVQRNSRGEVKGIYPLPSEGYTRYVDDTTGNVWYLFCIQPDYPNAQTLNRPKYTNKFLESELLIHYFETYDGYTGRGVLALARDAIEGDYAAQKFGVNFYKHGARPSGAVKFAGGPMNEETREMVRRDFERAYHGLDNTGKTIILDMGMDYQQFSLSQKDSQFIESRTFTVEEIARFTGIPEYMLQGGKQSYESNEQQNQDYYRNFLLPSITQDEEVWSARLLTKNDLAQGYYLKMNFSALLRSDDQARAKFYQAMWGISALNTDEIRAFEDMSPLPDGKGQDYYYSKNYAKVGSEV